MVVQSHLFLAGNAKAELWENLIHLADFINCTRDIFYHIILFKLFTTYEEESNRKSMTIGSNWIDEYLEPLTQGYSEY